MHLPTHLLLSWLVAHPLKNVRDRRVVTWVGVSPDLDALTLLGGVEMYSQWHHILGHNLLFGLVIIGSLLVFAEERKKVVLLALVSFHLHMFCDMIGSRWSIAYWWPFSSHEYFLSWRWPLVSWQNYTITLAALVVCCYLAYRLQHSFLEAFLPALLERRILLKLRLYTE